MAGSSHRPSPPPIPNARRHRSPPPRAPAAASSTSSRRRSPRRLPPPKRRRQPHRSAGTLDLPVPPTPVYHGVRQREWGNWVSEITDRNIGKKVWVGSFQSTEQAARAYDIANVHLHGGECGELNFPLEVPGPEVEPQGLRFVSARQRREDKEAHERLEAERRDAAMAAVLAGYNPELIEKEWKALEAFAEAKRKADAAAGKQVKKEEEAGPSVAPGPATVKKEEEEDWEDVSPMLESAVIELDSDSSTFEWDDED